MINVKRQLNKKELETVKSLINSVSDIYGDFYITKNNLRLFIKENKDMFFECLKRGDKIAWDETRGLIFVTGWSDKAPRKYIKILAKDEKSAEDLIKVLFWHTKEDLYAKVKKNNPLRKVLQQNQFRFAGDRGREILLIHKYLRQEDSKYKKEEVENESK